MWSHVVAPTEARDVLARFVEDLLGVLQGGKGVAGRRPTDAVWPCVECSYRING